MASNAFGDLLFYEIEQQSDTSLSRASLPLSRYQEASFGPLLIKNY